MPIAAVCTISPSFATAIEMLHAPLPTSARDSERSNDDQSSGSTSGVDSGPVVGMATVVVAPGSVSTPGNAAVVGT